MDINKYIGKFLQKNKYCSLPGLGVFDMKKTSASVGGGAISNPSYNITFTPVGTIDDTFASFIASLENVSISNASNAIRQYCIDVKAELAKTGKYEIERIGKFTMPNQKIVFHQSEDFDLGYEPVVLTPVEDKIPAKPKVEPVVEQKADYSYPSSLGRKKSNGIFKILVPLLIVVILAVAAYFAFNYFKNNKTENTELPANDSSANQVDTVAVPVDTTKHTNIDTLSTQVAALVDTNKPKSTDTLATTAVSAPAPVGKAYNVAVLSFDNEASATLKAKKLKDYGNNASVVNSNGRFVVTINASQAMNDTLRLVDSLRRLYNPKGPVYILK